MSVIAALQSFSMRKEGGEALPSLGIAVICGMIAILCGFIASTGSLVGVAIAVGFLLGVLLLAHLDLAICLVIARTDSRRHPGAGVQHEHGHQAANRMQDRFIADMLHGVTAQGCLTLAGAFRE